MRAFILYKTKSLLGFKRLVNTGGGVFDKYRSLAVSFIRYAGGDLDKNLAVYDVSLDLNSIELERVFPIKYKWMVGNQFLKAQKDYLNNLEKRIEDFKGKDDNLKILVGVLFLRFVLLTKMVESYLAIASEMKKSGQDISNLEIRNIGIGNSLLKYFDILEEFDNKSIDDWVNCKIDSGTASYFYSSMKRVLSILTSSDEF